MVFYFFVIFLTLFRLKEKKQVQNPRLEMDYKGFWPLEQEVFNVGNHSSGYTCGNTTLHYGVS